ncbi:MAG: hypothetical protein AAGF12_11030 [Myxococcota bacterium]
MYVEEGGSFVRLGQVRTGRRLLPGEAEQLMIQYSLEGRRSTDPVTFRVVVNDAGDMPLASLIECRPENNTAETTGTCRLVF